jgi:2-polyprenyl-3-methyl-5-hydroxy-6-metoxy-1,4-benzoquinol methylase
MKPPVFSENWPDDVMALYHHDMQEIWDKSIAPHIFNQYQNQLDYYKRFMETGSELKVLDVGCAQGTLALQLAELGHDVTALDLRPQFLDYAKTRYEFGKIKFVEGNALEMAFSEKFDFIFANQIIEHLVYPSVLMDQLVPLLKVGGKLIVTTPNSDYLKIDLPTYTELGDPKEWEHMQFTADGDGHFYAYTEGELIDIFNNAGLTQVDADFFETPWISGHMKIRYLHSILPSRLLKIIDTACRNLPYFKKALSHQLCVTGVLNG